MARNVGLTTRSFGYLAKIRIIDGFCSSLLLERSKARLLANKNAFCWLLYDKQTMQMVYFIQKRC